MPNETNSQNQELPKRKEIVADFKQMVQETKKPKDSKVTYTEEYKTLADQVYQFSAMVSRIPITGKKVEITAIKNAQRDFLLNMKGLLESLRTDVGIQGSEDLLHLEHVQQIQRRMNRTTASYGKANIYLNQQADDAYKQIIRKAGEIYARVEKKFVDRTEEKNKQIVQDSPYQQMNALLAQDPRHMDYPGITGLQALVSLPVENVIKEDLDGSQARMQAQSAVGNSANKLADMVCRLHGTDEETGTTKNLSHKDLKDLQAAYNDLLTNIENYRKLLPENSELQGQLATISTGLVQERTQVERGMSEIEKLANGNKDLIENARPFSIYEIEGRTNPDFGDGLFGKAQAVQLAGSDFRTRITQWKQNAETKQMLSDFDEMMSSFDHLNNEVLPQLMKLDRGERGYLSAMTPQEVVDLRDAYQDAVFKIDMFARNYGRVLKNKEQKDFQSALANLYPDMLKKYRMLDQLAGGDNVKDMSETLNILNEKRDELDKKEPPKKEKDQKELEQAEQNLSEEQQILKDVGYYQMLLNDGQLYPQMLFDSTESQRSIDLSSLRRETQILEGARKDFNSIMTMNRRMRACPDIDTVDAALAVNPSYPVLTEEDSLGFNRHFEKLKKQALELAGKMSVYYEADLNGSTKLLNMDEIKELEQAYYALSTESFYCGGWLSENDPRKAPFEALEKMCDERVKSLRAAEEYIQKNAPEYREAQGDQQNIVPRTRAFSLYELQGGMNPEIDNNALDDVVSLKEEMDAFQQSLNKLSNKALRQIEPIKAEYKAFAREIDNLYNNVIPDMLRMDPASHGFSQTVTRDKVQEALKEFEKATMAFIPLRVDYERRLKSNNPPITEEEKKMFTTVQKLNQRVSEKWLAMNYLLDRRAEELKQDIDRHNEQAAELREELKKYKDNMALPEDKRVKDLQLKHDAKFLAWAMQLEDLYLNKRLTPAAFFEEDPSYGRSHILSELRLTEQNINDVQMRAFYLGEQHWDKKGKRDLGGVREFQASLHQRNEFGTHTVMQYATKGKTQAKDIIETALRTMPAKLKEQQFDVITDRKLVRNKDTGRFEDEYTTQKMTLEQAIRGHYEKKVRESLHRTDEFLALDISNEDIYSLSRSGFAEIFPRETLENNRPLMYFVSDLNRALLNAGACEDTFDLHTDTNVPDGYNQGYAKIAAQALNDDLALRKTPEKNMVFLENREDQHGNKPAANLLPETRLWEQTRFQFGDARPEQAFNVVIASTEKNYAEKVPGDKTREFYTTTKNFRSSSFVGFTPTSVTQMPEYRNYMTAEELAQAEADIEQYFYAEETGKNKEADPYTSDVEDYRSFQDPTVLANASDLQAMGYLLGIPKYTADKLRIGFKLDEKGNLMVSNVLGTETDDFLFSELAPDDPSLVSPDDMLVMTAEMAQKVLDWSEGKFDANERAVKESLMRLPAKARESFQKRLQVLAAKVRESEAYKDTFDDVVDEEKKPGEPSLVGLQTKKGVIRILDRRDFNQLKMDDLAIGRNSGDYRTRETKPPVNIFDAVADLPKQSHLALMDKWGAIWSGDKSKEFGHVSDSRYGRNNYNRNSHEPMYERRFIESERNRSLMKMKRMVGDIVRMDRDRKKESFFHWDTGKYTDVLNAQQELDKALTLYAADHTIKSSNEMKAMLNDYYDRQKKNDEYYKRLAEVKQQNRKIAEENAKISEKNKTIKDKSKHTPLKAYIQLPEKEKIPEDQMVKNRKWVHDYRDMKQVKDAMLKLRKKLEIYLKARVNPSSEFGKMRYAAMLKMYNDINDRLGDYITYTGDTKDLPTTAKLVEVPPKDGKVVPEDKKEYKLVIEPMMDPAEWELRIPDVVRKDYIRAVRKDILEKAEKSNKKDAMEKAHLAADSMETMINRRYEQAKKVYDLNGKKKDLGFLDDFENLDNTDVLVQQLKKENPRRLRPVKLKPPKKKPEAPKISIEEQRRQAKAEYERLMKGGKKQGGFDFSTMSEPQPEPQPVPQVPGGDAVPVYKPDQPIIVNPPKEPGVKDTDITSIIAKEQRKRQARNNKGGNENIINNEDNKIDNNIINTNEKKDENIIINNEDNKINNNEKKNDNIIINNEDNRIDNKEDAKDQGQKNNDKKNVRDLDFDEIFRDVIPPNGKEDTFVRPNNNTNTNTNDMTKNNNVPTNNRLNK